MKRLLLPAILLVEMLLLAPLSGVWFGVPQGLPAAAGWYLHDLLVGAAPTLVLALGVTAVMMTGGIDLSVGVMTALVACVMAQFEPGPAFWLTAVPAGLATGVALGLTNGLLIGLLDVPPIIATLGTLFFYRGLCEALMRGVTLGPFLDVPGYGALGELTGALLLAGGVLAIAGTWIQNSRWRRELLMIGGNRIAARYAAIPVTRRLIEVYTFSGVMAFVAALLFTAHDGSVSPRSLTGLELQVIVAVVLGGTAVTGGHGALGGSIGGVLFVAVLAEGLRAGSGVFALRDFVPFKFSHLSFILLGALLLGGVWLRKRLARSG